jgi:hypothetical protein
MVVAVGLSGDQEGKEGAATLLYKGKVGGRGEVMSDKKLSTI